MSDTTTTAPASESLTLTMSPTDLAVLSKAMEKSVITMQMEYAELEKRASTLRQDIDRQVAMLSIMKSNLEKK